MKDTIFLCDRFILSELIYSKYLGRKPGETIDDIVNKDVYIFILWAENEAIIKRFNKRGDEFFKLKQIININTLFFNFYYKNHTLNLTEKTDLIYKPTNIWLCENSTFSQMKKNKEIILNKIKEIRSKK
jgi:thymidylate kinase